KAYRSFGKTASGTQRYRCNGCGKTVSKPKASSRQRETYHNIDIFKMLVNKVPLSRIVDMLGISWSLLYHRIDYIHSQCMAFAGNRESKLATMQKEKGIVVTDERLDVEMARLSELSSQITGLRMLKAESGSRSSVAQNNPDRVQDVLNNAVVSGLKTDLARQEGKLEELSSRYGDAHPQVLETRANIESLKQKIRQETSKVTSSVALNNNVNTSRESQAQRAYDEQRTRILKLKDDRSEIQVLEREVESAQRIYESIQSRLSQTNLESNSNQAGVYLLSPATEPTKHSSPRTLINLIVAATFGTFLAVIVALAIEMFNPRVRGAIDITQALDLPVIGVLPSPNTKGPRLSLSRRFGSNQAALPNPAVPSSVPAIS
ncbi:MAG: hypothetical protein RLZZ369_1434, partial [Pseudomonadota bacterium]